MIISVQGELHCTMHLYNVLMVIHYIQLLRNFRGKNISFAHSERTFAGSDAGPLEAFAIKTLTWTFRSTPIHIYI
jgi:hypothetical protein